MINETASQIENAIFYVSGYKRFMSGLNTELKPVGLSVESFLTLYFLAGSSDITTTKLSDALGLNLPTATKLLDRLVGDNYVHRKPHPFDRRQIRILLTEDGRQKFLAGQEVFSSFVDTLKKKNPNLADVILSSPPPR